MNVNHILTPTPINGTRKLLKLCFNHLLGEVTNVLHMHICMWSGPSQK